MSRAARKPNGNKLDDIGTTFFEMLRIFIILIYKTLRYSFCACVRKTPKSVIFVIGNMKVVSFSLFLYVPHRPKIPFTYVVNVYSDMSWSKGHLESIGKASKIN